MHLTGLIGRKVDQTQRFLQDGTRVPVTLVEIEPNVVTQIKSIERDGYQAIQLGFGTNKNATKPLMGHVKKAGREKASRFFKEVRVDDVSGVELGSEIKTEDIFKPGDIIDVTGRSKGKGYAGVVKRHHFKGGPRTHGQSDRERAPGSIGQTTTPGRVYKGKRMSGKMGDERSTIKNLTVLGVSDNTLVIKGLIPGVRGGTVVVRKKGEEKKFVGLFKAVSEPSKVEEKVEKKVSEEPKSEKAPVAKKKEDEIQDKEDVKDGEEKS